VQYFIGVVPPEDYKQKIVNFQKRAFNGQVPEIVEPHITVKAQGGLTEDLEWLKRVKEVCAAFPAFHLTIGEPKSFGSAILFLSTQTPEVVDLHKQLVEAIAPPKEVSEKYFELDLYTAHMTLAQTSWGVSEAYLDELKSEAEQILTPYPTFRVDVIRIYNEYQPGRYQPFLDVPLKLS
jgi:2'-5' RNA ligase